MIDLAFLGDPATEALLLKQWNDAFCHYGFCYLTSHGLQPLYERVQHHALQFFTSLTPDEKAAYNLQKGYGHGGYVAPGVESVAASRRTNNGTPNDKVHKPDPVESLCVHSGNAEHVPPFRYQDVLLDVPYKHGSEFKEAVQKLWRGLEQLLRKIMVISAKALQLPLSSTCSIRSDSSDVDEEEYYFDQFYQPGANFLRLAHYVDNDSNSESAPSDKESLRYGEHTDYQGFTLLWRNQSNGLQCAADMRHFIETNEPIQEWINVPVLEEDPHAIVVNAGDLIQRWTNDYWVSNMHRVVRTTRKAAAAAAAATYRNLSPLSFSQARRSKPRLKNYPVLCWNTKNQNTDTMP